MIVGLTGLPGVGKDTIAQRLSPMSQVRVQRRAFADPLKKSLAALLGISIEYLEELKRAEGHRVFELWEPNTMALRCKRYSMRQLLQRYGTEAHRDMFGEDFWVNASLPWDYADWGGGFHANLLLVFTDVRFANEANRIHACGGKVWEVTGVGVRSNHRSDEALPEDMIDRRVDNSLRDDGFGYLDHQLWTLLGELGLRADVRDDERVTSSGSA